MDYYIDAFRNYATFKGRASRKQYWMFVLLNFIISIAIGLVESAIGFGDMTFLSFLYSIAVIVPNLSIASRRLHDTGRSAWWILLALIPLVGAIVLTVLLIFDSEKGSNKYGENPKGIESGDEGDIKNAEVVEEDESEDEEKEKEETNSEDEK